MEEWMENGGEIVVGTTWKEIIAKNIFHANNEVKI